MTNIRPCSRKNHSVLALEWDQLADERHHQIKSGEDISFNYIIVPEMLQLCEDIDQSVVLDIGSGTGDFTLRLAKTATQIIGIEPSLKSISIAKLNCHENKNVQYHNLPLEKTGGILCDGSITAAVACMVLMTTPDLSDFAKNLSRLLRIHGRFVAIFTHPCFWPRYWNYEAESWFNYNREIFLEAPFKISKHLTSVRTTHVHRPLEMYLGEFAKAGFMLEKISEPMPSKKVSCFYKKNWLFPRFIAIRWEKI